MDVPSATGVRGNASHEVGVKRVRTFLVILLAALILAGRARYGVEGALKRLGDTALVRRLLLPIRVAALSAKPPDSRIAMPLLNVHVHQIANT